ncbi:hypothetical protein Q4493_15410 [Colwellia sp. 1_MG-2023]|uniref:hypothetical protein n=1 Tax=Colwellia sp. 1_MG-2023 TaxID=3062649 RepID=UPI0026E3DDB6|nr:hypothetical protein [Colwellia sp. 1_MG-2023]MDO6447158.1 hypothetical protein [Colwellia sp. 1_MG-2023]
MSKIEIAHEGICKWIQKDREGPVRSSQPAGLNIIKKLKVLAKLMFISLPSDIKENYSVHISTGKSNLPSVLWVSLTPKGRSVYNSMSVTACFSHEATGCVLGVMDAVTFPQKWMPTIERQASEIKVNLNKKGAKYQYNGKYVNPKEFTRHSFDAALFVEHLLNSCQILHSAFLEQQSSSQSKYQF